MKKIKLMGLLTITISLLLGISAVPAMAATYSSMDAMMTAIINGTSVKYTDIVNFGTYNSKTLQWIYMGPNQNVNETSEPYFVMTKDSFQIMNFSKAYDSSGDNKFWIGSELYAWLNGTFKTTNLNNDSRIRAVTLPSHDDYDDRIKNNISGEGAYDNSWWLDTWYGGASHDKAFFVEKSNGSAYWEFVSNTHGVRPAFYLKSDNLPNNPITFNGSTDLSDISISGSTVVNIVCAQTEGLTNQKYQWSLDSAKPSAGWISFTGNSVAATQAVAATWYLHVSCTDAFGHETYVKKKYTITTAGSGSTGTALDSGLAIGDTLTFGNYNSVDLKWIYMGNGYFIMDKNSFQIMNVSKPFSSTNVYNNWAYSGINLWLNDKNSGFSKLAFNNDSRIAYVTIPSMDEYVQLESICKEYVQSEIVSPSSWWWLRSATPDTTYVYGVLANGEFIYGKMASLSGLVRPAFQLKSVSSAAGLASSNSTNIAYTTVKNRPFSFTVPGAFGTVGTTVDGTTVAKIGGVDTTLTVVQATIEDGYIILENHPDYNDGKGFSGTGVKVVTVGTQKFYINVINPPASTGVKVQWH